MKKIRIRMTLVSVLSGLCFLGALIVGVPFLLERIFWPDTGDTFSVTKYIFISFAIFFLILLGVILPFFRRVPKYLRVTKVNPLDILVSILFVFTSLLPLIIVFTITIQLLRIKAYRYKIFHVATGVILFLLGVFPRVHGKLSDEVCIVPSNHGSPLDYPLDAFLMGIDPWNVVAGANLPVNRKTWEDKLVSFLLGPIIRDYSIQLDRKEKESRAEVPEKMLSELQAGKKVAIFPEGGRTTVKQFQSGIILRKFKKRTFQVAMENNIPVQPVVLDFPATWRGKDDPRWGLHPCIVDIYYLPLMRPSDYDSPQAFAEACWLAMENQLGKSKKIKRFLEDLA